ncbi:MAG TPA: RNA 2',3'-cyclic phosphodiesterase [Methanobacteriaceae archaeon]|nr:RNA 2',3'-cyclic phosphodiesterase [Methanobacteriaceae archaeon]
MRAFMAVEVPSAIIGKILNVQKQLGMADAHVKFVEGENLHFTVKFFGDITPEQAKQITQITEHRLEDQHAFPMYVKGTGVFPNLERARVVWLGVENPERFSQLQETLDQDWIRMGFRKERDYIPHLTIGRIKGPRNRNNLIHKIKELENVEIGPLNVEKLILKKSDLTPVGPMYTDMYEFPLG